MSHYTELKDDLPKHIFFGALPVNQLGLSRYIVTKLHQNDIYNLRDLLQRLLSIKMIFGLGIESIKEIGNKLLEHARERKKTIHLYSRTRLEELDALRTDRLSAFIEANKNFNLALE